MAVSCATSNAAPTRAVTAQAAAAAAPAEVALQGESLPLDERRVADAVAPAGRRERRGEEQGPHGRDRQHA